MYRDAELHKKIAKTVLTIQKLQTRLEHLDSSEDAEVFTETKQNILANECYLTALYDVRDDVAEIIKRAKYNARKKGRKIA